MLRDPEKNAVIVKTFIKKASIRLNVCVLMRLGARAHVTTYVYTINTKVFLSESEKTNFLKHIFI